MKNLKLIVMLYEYTGLMSRPWVEAGHPVLMIDGKHKPGLHKDKKYFAPVYRLGMFFEADRLEEQAQEIKGIVDSIMPGGDNVHLVFGFPECTYLTVSGNRWLYHPDDKILPASERRPHPLYPDRLERRADAIKLATFVPMVSETLNCSRWAFENPARGALNRAWRRPDAIFNPYDYGGYLPVDDRHPLYPDIYPPRDAYPKSTGIYHSDDFSMPIPRPVAPIWNEFPGFRKLGGRSARTKEIRSCTPRGFAEAVFIANCN